MTPRKPKREWRGSVTAFGLELTCADACATVENLALLLRLASRLGCISPALKGLRLNACEGGSVDFSIILGSGLKPHQLSYISSWIAKNFGWTKAEQKQVKVNIRPAAHDIAGAHRR